MKLQIQTIQWAPAVHFATVSYNLFNILFQFTFFILSFVIIVVVFVYNLSYNVDRNITLPGNPNEQNSVH